jgi:hypothetical protein
MGILSGLLLWPAKLPMSGSFWVAGQIAKAADAQYNDKTALRAALIEAENQLLAGDLSEDEYDVLETDLLIRLQAATG